MSASVPRPTRLIRDIDLCGVEPVEDAHRRLIWAARILRLTERLGHGCAKTRWIDASLVDMVVVSQGRPLTNMRSEITGGWSITARAKRN